MLLLYERDFADMTKGLSSDALSYFVWNLSRYWFLHHELQRSYRRYYSTVDTLDVARDAANVGGNLMAGRVSIRLVGLRVIRTADGFSRITLGKKRETARI